MAEIPPGYRTCRAAGGWLLHVLPPGAALGYYPLYGSPALCGHDPWRARRARGTTSRRARWLLVAREPTCPACRERLEQEAGVSRG